MEMVDLGNINEKEWIVSATVTSQFEFTSSDA
jgi:hypothetical protein